MRETTFGPCLVLLDLSVGSDECLREGTFSVHIEDDVASSNEGAADVNLGNSGPVRKVLNTLTELLVLQNVVVIVLGEVLSTQNVDNGAGEAALRGLGGTLHINDDRRGLDLLRDDIADSLGFRSVPTLGLDGSNREGRGHTGRRGVFRRDRRKFVGRGHLGGRSRRRDLRLAGRSTHRSGTSSDLYSRASYADYKVRIGEK